MGNSVIFNGREVPLRGGAWNDDMNSCFYAVVDNQSVPGYLICRENGTNELFALKGTVRAFKKFVELGRGITKTISRDFLRTDDRGRDIYAEKVTDYERNGVIVRVVEHSGYMPWGRENAHVWRVDGEGRSRSYKDTCNAHAKAYEMLIEATR